jgi:septum formation protein
MTMLILASASGARARLLREAGLSFGVRPADIDELALKNSLRAQDTDNNRVAGKLAEAKALNVLEASPQALVLGCDQVLLCEGRLFDKPRDIAEARQMLMFLRGKTHQLISALALARDGKVVWRHEDRASLHMRDFSETFLAAYLKTEGMTVMGSVGCYRLEGRGAQLFDRIEGDFFAILGLPLIALLGALREQGIVAS